MKNRMIVYLPVFVLTSALLIGNAHAAQPSSKTAVQVSNIALLSQTSNSTAPDQWVDLLSVTLKTSSQKDLLMFVSLECGLFARTLGRTRAGALETQMASGGVQVRLLVDGAAVAEPGPVVFCRKVQTLTTQLASGFSSCQDGIVTGVPDGIITPDECTLTEQQLELILDSMDANGFNFVLSDVGVGVHSVRVQARIDLGNGTASVEAKAAIGKGSLIVEEVRLIRNADITL